jgi:hypothetical protein
MSGAVAMPASSFAAAATADDTATAEWDGGQSGRAGKLSLRGIDRGILFHHFSLQPFASHGLNGSFIKRTLHLTHLFINRFFKKLLQKLCFFTNCWNMLHCNALRIC